MSKDKKGTFTDITLLSDNTITSPIPTLLLSAQLPTQSAACFFPFSNTSWRVLHLILFKTACYNTENYIQYLVIAYSGQESEKNIHTHIYV